MDGQDCGGSETLIARAEDCSNYRGQDGGATPQLDNQRNLRINDQPRLLGTGGVLRSIAVGSPDHPLRA